MRTIATIIILLLAIGLETLVSPVRPKPIKSKRLRRQIFNDFYG